MKKTILCALLTVFSLSFSLGQTPVLDSLEMAYENADAKEDKIRIALEMGLASKDELDGYAYAEVAEDLSENESDALKAAVKSGSAKVYNKFGDFTEAVELQEAAIELIIKTGSKEDQANAYKDLGKYQRKALMLNQSLTSYIQAEEIFESLGDVKGVIDCLNQRGVIHKGLENYAQALPVYHKAYDLARTNGLPNKLASTCVNIGVVLKKQSNYDEALNYYQRAEEIYVIENNYYGLANIYNNIGNVLREQQKFKKALEYFEFAIENRKKSKKLKRLSYTYNNIALVYDDLGQYDKAIEYLEKSEKHKIAYDDYETLASTYLNFSEVYLELNNSEKYYYYADLSEQLSRKYFSDGVIRSIKVNNGKFEAQNGNYKKAYAYLATVFDELDTLDLKSQKILASVLQAHFREKENKSEINELWAANDTLSNQKETLEYNQSISTKLIWALSIALIALAVIFILLLRKQRALTEKKKELESTNDQLRETKLGSAEKETLLKEIHHRVKNNLQIIKSLIRLQNSSLEDERMNDILQEFEQRVSSMALVHESLYKSDDLAKVDVSSYYEDLINDLINAYNVRQEITTEISIDIANLGLDTLVPLGLLTNEIISNSLKHGFDADTNGIIKVDLKSLNDGQFELNIGDNGKGFDFEQQRQNKSSLGTELILALVEQLDGEYEFKNEGGAYFRIIFKPQDKKAVT